MFDDPQKELERLHEQLLAAEEDAEPTQAVDLNELRRIIDADDWEGSHRQPLCQSYSDEADEEALFQEDFYVDDTEPEPDEAPRGSRSIPALAALLILETIALVGVIVWWLL